MLCIQINKLINDFVIKALALIDHEFFVKMFSDKNYYVKSSS